MIAVATQSARGRSRAGGRVLALLSDPLSVSILRLLAQGPLPTPQLSQRLGPASRTTRFSRLRELEAMGVIKREKRGGPPPVTYCMLSARGVALLPVVKRFAGWLARSGGDGSRRGKVADLLAIKALALGWETTALRWLAERPHTLTELARRCAPEVAYHDLRRARLALAEADLIEPVLTRGRGKPYRLTAWAAMAAGPLAAAARWERDLADGNGARLGPVEGETVLLLAAARIEALSGGPSGVCSLRFDGSDDVGLLAEVSAGEVSLRTAPEGRSGPRSALGGSASAWLDALLDGRGERLEMQGAIRLTTTLAMALSEACGS